MSGNVHIFQREDHNERVLSMMQDFHERRLMCDIVIIAGIDGTRVPANRIMLSANSSYFWDLFKNTSPARNETEVRLENVSGQTLEALINYCYSGHIQINADNVSTLLATVSQLQMVDLVNACEDFLNNNPYSIV